MRAQGLSLDPAPTQMLAMVSVEAALSFSLVQLELAWWVACEWFDHFAPFPRAHEAVGFSIAFSYKSHYHGALPTARPYSSCTGLPLSPKIVP